MSISFGQPLALKHPRVQQLRRLLGRRSARFDAGAFVVEGAKLVDEAMDADWPLIEVFVAAGYDGPILERCRVHAVPVAQLAPGVMEKVGDTVAPQPVMAVAEWRSADIEVLKQPLLAGGFLIMAADLRDPGNAGTLIRCAEICGALGVLLSDDSVDVTNPKTVRASAGSIFHIPVVTGLDTATVVETFTAWNVQVWATVPRVEGAIDYDTADLLGPTVIVLGNEANGLSEDLQNAMHGRLTIPMAGRTESLNVGMAAAVLGFECSSQRRRIARP